MSRPTRDADFQIERFRSLFKGREDIYARWWSKGDKSGYMPVYDVDWKEYDKHKARGGTFKTFKHKQPAPLTKAVIKKHLWGRETIGIYPLLKNSTSWFIAADFDGNHWTDECIAFLNSCNKHNLSARLERSRSGNGGHVWIFFARPYPSWKSRQIAFHLLRDAGVLSEFDQDSSFDRLFPSQDVATASGPGNLIALPLNKRWMANGDTCFINPATLEPYSDQWHVLQDIERVSPDHLDLIYESLQDKNTSLARDPKSIPVDQQRQTKLSAPGQSNLFGRPNQSAQPIQATQPNQITQSDPVHRTDQSGKSDRPVLSDPYNQTNRKLVITIDQHIRLNKSDLDPELVSFLRDELNLVHSDYLIKKKLGKNTFQTEKYFKLIEEARDHITIPRGFYPELIRFCEKQGLDYRISDLRTKLVPVRYSSGISLYDFQKKALEPTKEADFGVIVAPPGSGKTVMGLELVSRKSQPALIIVHRKQLFDQWVDRIQSFLEIPKKEIGQISGYTKKSGKLITVAMIQSLRRLVKNVGESRHLPEEAGQSTGKSRQSQSKVEVSSRKSTAESQTYRQYPNIPATYGTIIVDECHHIPAKTFRETITRLRSYYLYGLTATPMRKHNDERLIYTFIGNILSEIPSDYTDKHKSPSLSIKIRETELSVPFDYRTDAYETLSRILVHDTRRNQLIMDDLEVAITHRRSVLLLTERKDHIQVLHHYLKNRFETIALSGDDSKRSQNSKMAQIRTGHFQLVLSTGQYFGEGIDIDRFDCLFLVYPFSFTGKLIQYIGRIARSEKPPVIYDYRDRHIEYFERLFKKRNRYYNKIRKGSQMMLGLN